MLGKELRVFRFMETEHEVIVAKNHRERLCFLYAFPFGELKGSADGMAVTVAQKCECS